MIQDDVRKHCVRRFGEPSRRAEFSASGHAVQVLKWDSDRTPDQVNLYVTVGVSAHPLGGHGPQHRLEFFTGLLPSEDRVARPLALLSMEAILNRRELGHGYSMTLAERLWHGSQMHGFLMIRARSEVIPDLELPSGSRVEFLQAIPATVSEIAIKTEHGIDALLSHWEAEGVPFWDPRRSPQPWPRSNPPVDASR